MNEFIKKIERNYDEKLSEIKKLEIIYVQENHKQENHKQGIIRCLILITYASYESFFKDSINNYFEFIESFNISKRDLNHSLFNYSFPFKEFKDIVKLEVFQSLFLEHFLSTPKFKRLKYGVSNLYPDELIKISQQLGLEIAITPSDEVFIKDLVDKRNQIAHGNFLNINYEDFQKYHNAIKNVMEKIMISIIESIEQRKYLSQKNSFLEEIKKILQ